MPSSDTIAALRSQIDAILEAPGKPIRTRRHAQSASPETVIEEESRNRGLEQDSDSEFSSDAAYKKTLALLNASDKSERMIRDRLAQAGFPQSSIDTALERARGYGFINDIRYGEVLVRSRISQGRGCAGIERELAENDIDPFDIPGYPEEFGITPESELERALALLERKPPRAKNARDAAYRKLVQKGFSSSVSSSAARIWIDGRYLP